MPKIIKDRVLLEAFEFYRRKKYQAVTNLLEPLLYNYRESNVYYMVLASAFILQNDYSAAYTYFLKAHELHKEDANILYCLGLVHFLRGRIPDAIKYLLLAISFQDTHQLSKKLLSHIRTDQGRGRDNSSYLRTKTLPKVVPANVSKILTWTITPVGVILLAVLGYFLYPILLPEPDVVFSLPKGQLINQSSEDTNSTNRAELLYTSDDVRSTFKEIEDLFLSEKDAQARILLNSILLSDVTTEVRTKAEHVKTLLNDEPNFLDHIPEVTYQDVLEYPLLYEEVAVSWSGKIANIRSNDTRFEFDFLIGYVNQQLLEGIVEVRVPFPISLENEDSVEILGIVTPDQQSFYINAVSIRKNIAEN